MGMEYICSVIYIVIVITFLIWYLTSGSKYNDDDKIDKFEGFYGGYYFPYDYPFYYPYFYSGCNENVFGEIHCMPLFH